MIAAAAEPDDWAAEAMAEAERMTSVEAKKYALRVLADRMRQMRDGLLEVEAMQQFAERTFGRRVEDVPEPEMALPEVERLLRNVEAQLAAIDHGGSR